MTARWLAEAEAEVLRHVTSARGIFCFLDYDGTLAPLAPTPAAAVPLAGTAPLLQDLVALPGVAVALVTGRTIADVRSLLDVPGLYYVGLHGLETAVPNGTVELPEGVALIRSILPRIKRRIGQALGGRPGIVIEDKGLALACHYRLASRADAAHARQTMMVIAQDYQRRGAPLAVTHGHEVIEIRSAFANKGRTACRLRAAHAPSSLVLYAGDDRTDEDAFTTLPPDSITIRVGPATAPTAARYRVGEPEAVLRFLRAVVACRRSRQPGAAETLGG